MKKFLIESAIFTMIVALTIYWVFTQSDRYTDYYYWRVATPKQSSLILGSSKAAQGIHPAVLNRVLSRNDFFNFSFNISVSPYGPTYLDRIEEKLEDTTRNGIFILTVDPYSISSRSKDPDNIYQFRELKLILGKTPFVNINPNIYYLLFAYDNSYYKLLCPHNSTMFLHNDGWLEVDIKTDSAIVANRIQKKVKVYRERNLPYYKFSKVRLEYLVKTIEFLKQHGHVYLVRLPVHPLIFEIDNQVIPDFNDKMNLIAGQTNTPYFDMSYLKDQFIYTDGNHVYKEDGVKVSELIGNWILADIK